MSWNKAAQETYKRNGERFETDLTDREWELIEALLPPPSRMGRQRTTDLREVINAIQYMLGTGCQWRAIPKCFPPFTTVQNYFYAWRDDGTFETMMDVLRGHVRELAVKSSSKLTQDSRSKLTHPFPAAWCRRTSAGGRVMAGTGRRPARCERKRAPPGFQHRSERDD